MIVFDINQPPPTRQELAAEKTELAAEKKRLIRLSLVCDLCHGLFFLGLFMSDLLSGYALLAAIGLGTIVAVALASTLKKQLRNTDMALVALVATGVIVAAYTILTEVMAEKLLASLLASLAAGSIVIAGAVIGRKFFHVFTGLENLRNVAEDEYAEQELLALCQQYPALEDYRQQAREILRPNLTFGELQAMQEWLQH